MEFLTCPAGVQELTLGAVKPAFKKAKSKAGNEYMQESFRFIFQKVLEEGTAYVMFVASNTLTDRSHLTKLVNSMVSLDDSAEFLHMLQITEDHIARAEMLDQLRGFTAKAHIEHNDWNGQIFTNIDINRLEGRKLSLSEILAVEGRTWDQTAFNGKGAYKLPESNQDSSTGETASESPKPADDFDSDDIPF